MFMNERLEGHFIVVLGINIFLNLKSVIVFIVVECRFCLTIEHNRNRFGVVSGFNLLIFYTSKSEVNLCRLMRRRPRRRRPRRHNFQRLRSPSEYPIFTLGTLFILYLLGTKKHRMHCTHSHCLRWGCLVGIHFLYPGMEFQFYYFGIIPFDHKIGSNVRSDRGGGQGRKRDSGLRGGWVGGQCRT